MMAMALRVIPVAVAIANLLVVSAAATDDPPVELEQLSAHQAVRTGNRLLVEGDPGGALQAYGRAEKLQPAAREIPFVQGLAHFAQGAYEQARQTFEKAAAAKSDALADDAEYGLGTTYHAEALKSLDNPEAAISHFESAMQRYHNVLANRPDHPEAREANLKAATMWRQVKKLLEQQQQQQQQENQDGENNEESQEQQESQPQDEGDQQEQKEPQGSQQEQDEQEEDQQSQADPSKDQENEQQQAQPQRQEQDLREQAQRRLREMMQALRQRKKARREQEAQAVPVAPVDKDW